VHLLPMQKVFCDARVLHPATGVNFYRIQGTTGWIFDRTSEASDDGCAPQEIMFEVGNGITANGSGSKAMLPLSPSVSTTVLGASASTSSGSGRLDHQRCMIIPEYKVKTGLFCFRALYTMVIRSIPATTEDCMTRHIIKAGEMVTVDIIRESPLEDDGGDGPFLRLTDGSGWLFEYKHDVKVMEEVVIKHGIWEVKVLNPPVGVGLRRHPIDSQTKMFKTIYPTDTMLQCDCKVVGHNGVAFYRVRNTIGWIFDQRGDSDLLKELSADEENAIDDDDANKNGKGNGWTPDFVRGIAATVEGLEENPAWEGSKVLTFRVLPDMNHVPESNNENEDIITSSTLDTTAATLLQALSDTNGSHAPTTPTTSHPETKAKAIPTLPAAAAVPTSSTLVALCFHIFYESRTVGIYDEIVQRQACERDCSTKDLVRLFNSSVAQLSNMFRQASPEPSFTDSVLAAAAAGPPALVLNNKKAKKMKPIHQRRFEMGSFDAHSFESPTPSYENGILSDLDIGEEKKQDYSESLDQVMGKGNVALNEAKSGSPNDLQEVELRTQLVRCEEALLNVRQQQVDILKSLKEFDDKRARVALQAKEVADERRMEDEIEEEAKRVMSSSHHPGEHNQKTSVAARLSGGGGSGSAGGVESVRNSTGSGSSRKLYHCEHCDRSYKSFQRLEQHRERADHW
jgi:hypothetical protein